MILDSQQWNAIRRASDYQLLYKRQNVVDRISTDEDGTLVLWLTPGMVIPSPQTLQGWYTQLEGQGLRMLRTGTTSAGSFVTARVMV